MRRNRYGWVGGVFVLTLVACFGGDGGGAAGGAGVAGDGGAVDTSSIRLMREVYTYRGGARDPFRSLVSETDELRPFIEDLRITSIVYDARYPARSVVVMVDQAQNRRYRARPGDQIGRLRVREIRQREVVLVMDELGEPRQVVLTIRRQEGTSP